VSGPLFEVEIVSPARPLFRGEAGAVAAESHEGQVGILPGHAPLVSLLGTGVVRVHYAGLREGDERFAVRGGFLQVLGRTVTLLVTEAVRAAEVDAAKAGAALERTLAALQHPKSDEEFERLLDERRWFEAQIRIAAK